MRRLGQLVTALTCRLGFTLFRGGWLWASYPWNAEVLAYLHTMSNKSDDLLVQNKKKIEECKLANLNSVEYKRGVSSALGYFCPLKNCGKTISCPRDLLVHIKAAHKLTHMWYCIVCNLFFPRVSDLVRHDFYVHRVAEWSNASHFWSERSACAALGCWHKRSWPL